MPLPPGEIPYADIDALLNKYMADYGLSLTTEPLDASGACQTSLLAQVNQTSQTSQNFDFPQNSKNRRACQTPFASGLQRDPPPPLLDESLFRSTAMTKGTAAATAKSANADDDLRLESIEEPVEFDADADADAGATRTTTGDASGVLARYTRSVAALRRHVRRHEREATGTAAMTTTTARRRKAARLSSPILGELFPDEDADEADAHVHARLTHLEARTLQNRVHALESLLEQSKRTISSLERENQRLRKLLRQRDGSTRKVLTLEREVLALQTRLRRSESLRSRQAAVLRRVVDE
ncbi:hypothetical protein GMRT_11014 [Giardia muris]|uniref:Uncharacterized protein n=1 Tax=Giardia muris TaxID=5742 RepID=A0A4Z1T9V8_GIAMU|nr:hypothetical protein GMRT_11014 [Giardia muris]|eukprot:TNJ29299.1 hypothetical protein GMRT_11014 [Giardia muris]